MNYSRIYVEILENRKLNELSGYTETHHIIPKSLGGTDNKENLVDLSAREHFICHLLLTKMYPEGSVEWIKMTKAFMCMMFRQGDNQERYINSHWYSFYREKFSKAQSLNQLGQNNSSYGSCWIYNEQLRQSKKISKKVLINYLNKGWRKGRVKNWNRFELLKSGYSKNCSTKNIQHFLQVKQIFLNKKDLFSSYYKIYMEKGYKEFKNITGWDKTQAALVMNFKKYVNEFKPQRGINRNPEKQKKEYKIICKICGKIFFSMNKNRQVCSLSCSGKLSVRNKKK